ncbi:ATP-dependent RNA helicase, putative [Lyngbya sp. PCC 8106]|nr:ATP-dependent RNA helicase, putative [Lyngbya sp. PCC 8106]
MLSSFLNIPFSVGRGSANVNAGSIFASYLVFDELHLFDPDRAFTTAIKVLQQVQGISPFLLMTATLTDELAIQIQQEIKAVKTEIVKVGDEDLAQIENNRCRTFQAVYEPLTADVIYNDIQKHNRKRVIIICNTVSQSQGIFKDLEDLNENNQFKITLLHSRFIARDRTFKEQRIQGNEEQRIQGIFAENWEDDGYCHILVSTQVIEAGINITCEVMHSQLCPMNSLLQRVGRCARFAGEQGEVYIYQTILTQVDEDEWDVKNNDDYPKRNKRKYLPYSEEICEQTWEILINHTNSEQHHKNINFRIEEDWINQIHTTENILQAEQRQNQKDEFERNWEAAIFRGDKSVASELIRFIDSRSVFLWEEKPVIVGGEDSEENTIDVSQLEAFSIPIGTLCKVFNETQEEAYRLWGCAFHRVEPPQKGKEETYTQDSHSPIGSISVLRTSARILLNTNYVYYDRNIGLVIGKDIDRFEFEPSESELNQSQKKRQVLKTEYQYKMDTYVGHFGCMWTCWQPFKTEILKNGRLTEVEFSSVINELFKTGGKFIQSRIFPNTSTEYSEALFEILVFLAILTHDLGKLQQKWQEVMRGWQTLAYQQFQGKNPKQFLIAHTDYNPTIPEQKAALKIYEKGQKRPPHARESAYLSQEILEGCLIPILEDYFQADEEQMENIFWVILMATGRHHSAWTQGWKTSNLTRKNRIKLHPQAKNAIAESWRQLGRFLPNTLPLNPTNLCQTCYNLHELPLDVFKHDQTEYQQLYTLVVRALRLCDQRSVQ